MSETMNTTTVSNKSHWMAGNLGMPIIIVMLLAMIILPLPAILLDLLFTFNIAFSLLILLVSVYTTRPLEFAVFPMILLLSTLLRLSLNIASTRVVLLHGHSGPEAAGQVIQSFGAVVIGSNYAVGLIVFIILVIINFVVITKGAGRISEVSARFTLDAMPGKQMAIDADLNAGIINQAEAKARREEVSKESDFYGAMDGASKFVRGDAVAGILILFVNIIGGVLIGCFQQGLPFMDAVRIYSLLTIGDGLAAQVPSILLSTAAGMMVTRVSTTQDINKQFSSQLFSNHKAALIAGGILLLLGVIPGMPHFVFIFLAMLMIGYGYYLMQKKLQRETADTLDSAVETLPPGVKSVAQEDKELTWDDMESVDPIGLEIGYRLIPLVDEKKDGELAKRIKGVRKKLSKELGFLIPPVHISDNLNLKPAGYRISMMGVTLSEYEVQPDQELAINPGEVFGKLNGTPTKDPAFGLDAIWIQKNSHEQAQSQGYTVVDCPTVVATHLSQLIQDHAYELLGHHEVEKLLALLEKSAPKLVENLIPGLLPMASLVKVLQNLLMEHIPIRDFKTIVETLAGIASKSQDPAVLTEAVRVAQGRMIVQQINGTESELPVMTLNQNLEQILLQAYESGDKDELVIEPNLSDALQQQLIGFARTREQMNEPAVLLVSTKLRRLLSRFSRLSVPNVFVLAYSEIPDNKQIRVISVLGNK